MRENCETIKPGQPCIHWKKDRGCVATKYGKCVPVVTECKGCEKVDENGYCEAYAFPRVQWMTAGSCPLKPREEEKKEKKFVNPLKASKRGE